MTQCYLVGEFSVQLAELCPQRCPSFAVAFLQLRERVERSAPCELAPLVCEALSIADAACWALLEAGDTESFTREACGARALREFAACADLLP